MDLQKLKDPMPYQWRVQSFSKFKPQAMCVAYIDARDVMDVLDKVCGAENWQSDYKAVDGQMFAGIGIHAGDSLDVNGGWVWKWDTGSESNIEAEKGQASDSFKRAAVKWGIGRFLYDLPIKVLTASEVKTKDNFPFVVDEQGQRVWDLSKHINSLVGAAPKPVEKPKPVKVEPPKKVADSRRAEIKDLLIAAAQSDLKTVEEYRDACYSLTNLELKPENFTEIITRLKAQI